MVKTYELKRKNTQKTLARREFEGISKKKLIDMIVDLRNANANLEKMLTLNQHKGNKRKKVDVGDEKDYDQAWPYSTKVVFLLKMKGKPLTSLQLHELLMRLDKHYPDYNNPKSNLNVILSRAVGSKRIIKIKTSGIKELHYALSE